MRCMDGCRSRHAAAPRAATARLSASSHWTTRVPCHHQMHQGRTKCTAGAQQAVQSRSRNGSATWCTRISCWQHWGRRPRAPGRGGKTVEAWLHPLHWTHVSPRLMAAPPEATARGDEAWSEPRWFRREANASAIVGREGDCGVRPSRMTPKQTRSHWRGQRSTRSSPIGRPSVRSFERQDR